MGEDTATEMEVKDSRSRLKLFNKISINKNLIMLKFTLFFLYGATSSLVPYLTIHMQSIGLTMEEIALIYLSLPFTTFLAPPLTGYLVDKFGQYKPVVIISFVLTAAFHHSLLLIPHQETPGVVPAGYVIRHPKKAYVDVWWSPCRSRECPDTEELDVVLDLCEDHCLLSKPAVGGGGGAPAAALDPGSLDDLVFHLGKKKNRTANGNQTAIQQFTLDMHPNLGDPTEQLGIDLDSAEEDDDIMELTKRFSPKLFKKYGVNVTELEENDLRCGGIVLVANTSTKSRLSNYSNDCIVQKCQFRSGGPEVCPPDYKESDDKTFWVYFVLRFIGTIIMTGGITVMDPVALSMIEKYGGDFGKERLFSSLGMALFSPITGILIDLNSQKLGYTDYSAAFYTFDVLLVISAVAVFMMPLGTKLPADNIFRDLMNLFKMTHVVFFILFLFFLGNIWGFIENFLFLYLKILGAPTALLGITVTIGTLSSLPFLYGAEKITRRIGHVNVVIVAFFAHAARLMGYSFIESPWWCFPFEAMESVSVHLMWVAAATYCATLAPKGLLATLIGVCGMAHFSIGRGAGSFVGGHVIGKVGIRQAFRLVGLAAVAAGSAYALLHFAWLRGSAARAAAKAAAAPTAAKSAATENEDGKKGKGDEPKFKDQATMVSFERLSLVVEYNQIGSLTSLGRAYAVRARSNSIRRGSYSGATVKNAKSAHSKNDLLKSAIEVNHSRNSNQNIRTSSRSPLNKYTNSSGRLTNDGNLSVPRLSQRSQSLAQERELENLIPNERDEIVYDEIKRKPIMEAEDNQNNQST